MADKPDTTGPGPAPDVEVAVEVDARGLRCPQPVINLAKAVQGRAPGDVVRLLADDPTAEVDVPVWCRMRRQRLVWRGPAEGGQAFLVEVR